MSRITLLFGVFLSHFLAGCVGQLVDNTPPVLTLQREWLVSEEEPEGTVVTRVQANDDEGDTLEYGLEHLIDYSNINAQYAPLPFTINNKTGVVYTNQSLSGMAGKVLRLYVTAFDGQLTQKVEVHASIRKEGEPPPNTISYPGQSNYPLGFPPPQFGPRPKLPSNFNSKLFPVNLDPSSEEVSNESDSSTSSPSTKAISSTQETTTSTTIPPQPDINHKLGPNPMDIALTIVPFAVLCVAFGLAGVAAFLFRKRICRYKKKKPKKEDLKKTSNGLREDPMVMQDWRDSRDISSRYEAWDSKLTFPVQEPPQAPIKPSDRWEFPRHHLKVFSILGEGCFGQVWKCEALNIDGKDGPSTVAVKTLKENAGERERLDLLQELQVMKMLDPHPNVVRLLGCCTEKEPYFVIMEYVMNGKLQSFLRNSRAQRSYDNMHGKSNSLTSRQLTSFCYQVARGMQFLTDKGIIHRDLAARNVLVGENNTCKVADFGFARDVVASHVYERKSEGRLPIRWMAPESLYDNIFSVKSDIWSFGVLIWEIVTLGSTPYPGLSAADVMKKVKDGYRLDKPEHCRRELYNIMYYCWNKDSKERPDFAELVDLLDELLLSETDYIELQRFPDHSYYNIVSLSGEKV